MLRWLCALVIGGIVSGFALLLLSGRYINDGPVVLAVSQGHGLHLGDLFVIGGWVVAMLSVLVLAAVPAHADRR